jgi:hypothetical protein
VQHVCSGRSSLPHDPGAAVALQQQLLSRWTTNRLLVAVNMTCHSDRTTLWSYCRFVHQGALLTTCSQALALEARAWPTVLLMCDMLQHDISMLSAAACSSFSALQHLQPMLKANIAFYLRPNRVASNWSQATGDHYKDLKGLQPVAVTHHHRS